MLITKEVQKSVSEVEDILCNKCGLTCSKEHAPGYYGLIEASVSGGYGSNEENIQDGDVHTFSLCERCCSELFKSFKIPSYVDCDLFL